MQDKAAKTRSVSAFLNAIQDPEKQKGARTLLQIMKEVTGERPVLWGSMIGFGKYHYRYESGREGDSFITGFAPRKQNFTIYIMPGYQFPAYQKLLEQLGPHSLGKSCLYIKKLEDIRLPVLKKIIERGYRDMMKKYRR